MTTKIFRSGNSMALRLPKELSPVEGEVEIEVLGDTWVIRPKKQAAWPKDFFKKIQLHPTTILERPPQGEHRAIDL